VICQSLELAEKLDETLHIMYDDVNIADLNEKYGAISNEELLGEYMTDDIRTTNDPFYSNGQQ
jgi:hypothetical protein